MQNKKLPEELLVGLWPTQPHPRSLYIVVFAAKCTLCQSSYSTWITGYGAKMTMLLLCSVFTRIQAHGQHVKSLVKL